MDWLTLNAAKIGQKQLQWRAHLAIARFAAVQRKYLIEIQYSWLLVPAWYRIQALVIKG
jgi:hypothetical protein